MSGEVFLSSAGAYNVEKSDVEVYLGTSRDRPITIRLGNIIMFTTFDVLDSLVTIGAFTRDAWLRAQTKCESCKGTGMTGHPESPDSCAVCRGTGIGGA